MRYLGLTIVFLCVIPLSASAAYLYSNTESSADSGGNIVGQGGSVQSGSSYSSSYVESDVRGSGKRTVHIEAEIHGKVEEQSFTGSIPSGGFRVGIATSSKSGGNKSEVNVRVRVGASSSPVAEFAETVAEAEESDSRQWFSFANLPALDGLFRQIVSWLKWW